MFVRTNKHNTAPRIEEPIEEPIFKLESVLKGRPPLHGATFLKTKTRKLQIFVFSGHQHIEAVDGRSAHPCTEAEAVLEEILKQLLKLIIKFHFIDK